MFRPIASRLLLRSILSVLAAAMFYGQLAAGDEPQKDLERNTPGRDPNRPYALFHSLPLPRQ